MSIIQITLNQSFIVYLKLQTTLTTLKANGNIPIPCEAQARRQR